MPEALWQAMARAPVTTLTASLDERVTALLADYAHHVAEPDRLLALLPALIGLHSRAQVAEWERQVRAGEWREFVGSLLERHYDLRYAPARRPARAYAAGENVTTGTSASISW